MIFKQYENGSCDIEFSQEEIKLINKKGKIHLSDENLRHFGNHLIKIIADWNLKFNDEVKILKTFPNQEVNGE